jgi:predicted nucleotide-binding protein
MSARTSVVWEISPESRKREEIQGLLAAADPTVLDHLYRAVEVTRMIFDDLADAIPPEVEMVVRDAGGHGKLNNDWSERSVDGRQSALYQLLVAQDNDVLSRLAELAAEDRIEPTDEDDQLEATADHDSVAPKPNPGPLAPGEAHAEQPRDDLPTVRADGPIFVVHGHAVDRLHELVRVLERATNRDVTVLHEQANGGRTILEKFEHHAAGAAYAVVLLTADDLGNAMTASAPGASRPRGRQNVIFELGFFFGKLGRERVAVLMDPAVERPSDIDGLVYITLDSGGAWKNRLAHELASVGLPIDFSRIP